MNSKFNLNGKKLSEHEFSNLTRKEKEIAISETLFDIKKISYPKLQKELVKREIKNSGKY